MNKNNSNKIKHPIIFSSLHTIQIKEYKDTHKVDWNSYANKVISYINYYHKDNKNNNIDIIITPKYDGCPFEIHFDFDKRKKEFSTQGDGKYGKDISKQLTKCIFNEELINYIIAVTISSICQKDKILSNINDLVIRGEVLIDKSVFKIFKSTYIRYRYIECKI